MPVCAAMSVGYVLELFQSRELKQKSPIIIGPFVENASEAYQKKDPEKHDSEDAEDSVKDNIRKVMM
jgi:hypothetical protein